MRKILLSSILASAVFAICPTSGFAANIVADGTFTTSPLHGGYNTFFSGQTFGPWTVTGSGCGAVGCAGVDVVPPGNWQAPPGGGNTVDLDGLAPGGITQTVALTTGKKYDLSFYLSANPQIRLRSESMTVAVGNLDQSLTYSLGPTNRHSNMNYVLENFVFTANGNDMLSFSSNDSINSPYGPVIGDVSITSAIPEPATWALFLIGFGALGFVMQSRRKQLGAGKFA